jgi:hypothetical protein
MNSRFQGKIDRIQAANTFMEIHVHNFSVLARELKPLRAVQEVDLSSSNISPKNLNAKSRWQHLFLTERADRELCLKSRNAVHSFSEQGQLFKVAVLMLTD